MEVCITVPTYNEAENIVDLLTQIRAAVPAAHVLVIDDNSPDGTSQLVASMAETDEQLHLLTRTTQRGRGSAGRDGFLWALGQGALWAVEMDADFSHHPRYLPEILKAAQTADVVLGSRYVKGGKETGRPLVRQWITKFAGKFLRLALGVPVRDPTAASRPEAGSAPSRAIEKTMRAPAVWIARVATQTATATSASSSRPGVLPSRLVSTYESPWSAR